MKDAAKARFIADPEGKGIARADVIIEAIVERLDVKQKLFADLETKIKPGAIMATNTSSLKLEDIAAADEGSGPPDRPALLLARAADAAGRSRAWREDARRRSAEGRRVRDGHRQVSA